MVGVGVVSEDPEIRRNWAGGSRSDRLASVVAGHAAFRRPGSPRQRTASRVRRRGRRGGVRQRLRRLGLRRLPLPSIILGNAQSLRNKVDELQANVEHISEYRDACVIALTETWLKDYDPTQDFDIDGFGQPYQLDRDAQITGKSLGGGVCLYVNPRWCKSVKIRESICSPHIELLSVSLRPFYLPREIPQVFLTVVYIHPRADTAEAASTIAKLVHQLQNKCPDAPHFILGDFNTCSLKQHLGHLHQYVKCPTRHGKILDLCYGTIKGAYKSFPLAPLGFSDHSCVLLAPVYQPALKKGKVERKEVALWTESAIRELNGCLHNTNWDVFKDSCTNLDELTDTVVNYITFCEEMIIPRKTITLYPNNKPWVSKSLKNSINKKKIAYYQGDISEQKEAQKLVKREIKLAKMQYKDKVQDEFRMGNSRSAWRGIKSMMGIQDKKKRVSNSDKSDSTLAEELNQFYLRFDSIDFSGELSKFREVPVSSGIQIDEISVWSNFGKTNPRKSYGPDGISGRLLKCCAPFLSEIFTYIFQWSLSLNKVPTLWKESTIVPVAKVPSPKTLNDYHPVALTSVVMKSFERIVKKSLLAMTQTVIDPLQFAYQPRKGVKDAVATLLNLIVRHLEGRKTHIRLCFADFSSAFNCMQPLVLAHRLSEIPSVDLGTICWLVDFLTTRPQRTRVNETLSGTLLCSTGSPQGCVLSPLLFMLYTNDCKSTFESRHIIKFADDSVIVSLLQDHEAGHGPVLDHFVRWCDDSYLQLNVSKTKDMKIDFRKNPPVTAQTFVKGTAVDTVNHYKYLGTILDDKLSFESNSDAICRKVNQSITANKKKVRKVGENHDSSQHTTISYNFAMEGQILTKQVTIDDGPWLKMSMQKLYILKTSPPVDGRQYDVWYFATTTNSYNFAMKG
ncbi:hypothetical protein JOB18_039315 [Solea senegalensis]|uniref:Reverse transcriptase domain-containing protein n=1 Tax=Solea senegalensis TaxID=28829 RepID=A0AAV6R3E6_SOLSE|nr:hypothetical protein JOB18_039315 [Solea senegalensis]